MTTLQATKVPIDVEALAEAAKREPVTVLDGDKEAFVVVEPAQYRRLLEDAEKARRIEAGRRAVTIMNEIGKRVAEQATPEEIAELEREIIRED